MVVYGKKIEGACQRGRASEREREREREEREREREREREADDTARGAKCEERGGA
jgi:hypothetical protein